MNTEQKPAKVQSPPAYGLMTWTCNNFIGHYSVPVALVVTADNIEVAIKLIENKLSEIGLPQTIKPEQLVPLPTHHRYIRILSDGDY